MNNPDSSRFYFYFYDIVEDEMRMGEGKSDVPRHVAYILCPMSISTS